MYLLCFFLLGGGAGPRDRVRGIGFNGYSSLKRNVKITIKFLSLFLSISWFFFRDDRSKKNVHTFSILFFYSFLFCFYLCAVAVVMVDLLLP